MIKQKKSVSSQGRPSHRRGSRSLDKLSFGPPKACNWSINAALGYRTKTGEGLKRQSRKKSVQESRQESNAYIAMRVGEVNIMRRFKRLRYLQSWDSKKPVFNVCEERTIARLRQECHRIGKA